MVKRHTTCLGRDSPRHLLTTSSSRRPLVQPLTRLPATKRQNTTTSLLVTVTASLLLSRQMALGIHNPPNLMRSLNLADDHKWASGDDIPVHGVSRIDFWEDLIRWYHTLYLTLALLLIIMPAAVLYRLTSMRFTSDKSNSSYTKLIHLRSVLAKTCNLKYAPCI